MFKQIIIGLFVAGLGGVLIYFSQAVAEMFGRVDWFERNLGSTRNGYILFGFGAIVIGFLILFGVFPVGGNTITSSPTTTVTQTSS